MAPQRFLNLVLLALPFGLVACDNPLCVFAPNGCQNQSGGESLGSQPASVPVDGAWIVPTAPTVQSIAPSTGAHPGTPIVITFSESLGSSSLGGAFEIVETSLGAPVPFLDPPPLTGDGRMVVLTPLIPLQLGGTYSVRFTEDGEPSDMTGQLVVKGDDLEIGLVSVATTTPTIPEVIATFPPDLSAGQSDIGEMVVVFDREMDDKPANPFDTDSWVVTVNNATPAINPDPQPLAINSGPISVTIDSVWTWASEDSLTGARVSLGPGSAIEVQLSPPGDKLVDADGNQLPATVFEYTVSGLAVPAVVEKGTLSDPVDAIGRPNLNDVVPVLQAQLLASAQVGDFLDLYLFGQGTAGNGLVALQRSVAITAPTALVGALPTDLNLLTASSLGVVQDGNLHVAASLRRGGLRTAIRLLDIDPTTDGAQPIRFDVTAPALLGLGTSGTAKTTFTSEVRDLVVVGRSNERIARVEVSTGGGADNAASPGVAMANDGGLFVASPVAIGGGVIDPALPETFTVRIYDRALNPMVGTANGTFFQRGANTGVAPEGGTVDVYVYDQATLAPLQGAFVMVHEDNAGVFSPVVGGSGSTDSGGFVSLPAAGVGTETIVTVDLNDYGLWTMHGVRTDALHVPLTATALANATTEGTVTSPFPLVNLSTFRNQIGDSRRPEDQTPLIDVDSCGIDSDALVFSCPFGPADILSQRLGAQVFLSADFSTDLVLFTPAGFLRAFATRFPVAPALSSAAESGVDLFVEELLFLVPAEEGPIEMPAQGLDEPANFAPGLGALDPAGPQVTVEAIAPGLPQALPVGLGIAYDTVGNPGPYAIRGAYPGAFDGIDNGGGDLLGEHVTSGAIQADLFIRAEIADVDGNRVGARPRFSNEDMTLDPPDVPTLVLPAPGGNSGGATYTLTAPDVLLDASGMEGLWRFEIQEDVVGGRSWTIWRPDPTGDTTVSARVPDVTDFLATPLADGPMTCRVSAYAWTSLDLTSFLWTDVDREYEVFAHTLPIPFMQP